MAPRTPATGPPAAATNSPPSWPDARRASPRSAVAQYPRPRWLTIGWPLTAPAALEAEAQAAAQDPAGAPPPRRRGRPPTTPPGTPPPTAQRNFTDPDSRIMTDADQAFVQAYNAQVAVERRHQIIVTCTCTNQAADAPHAVPLVRAVRAHTRGRPWRVLADAGYWSAEKARRLTNRRCEPFLATDKLKHSAPPPPPRGRISQGFGPRERMRRNLQTHRGRRLYAQRKGSVEPVFGLIKRARGFRQFLLPGARQGPGRVGVDLYRPQPSEVDPERQMDARVKPTTPSLSNVGGANLSLGRSHAFTEGATASVAQSTAVLGVSMHVTRMDS